MTTRELVSKYRACGPQELPVLLHFLADHWYELRLIGGGRLTDVIDSATALRELAEAFRFPENPEPEIRSAPRVLNQLNVANTCMSCSHVHEGDDCCGVDLGKGGVCECKAEVRA